MLQTSRRAQPGRVLSHVFEAGFLGPPRWTWNEDALFCGRFLSISIVSQALGMTGGKARMEQIIRHETVKGDEKVKDGLEKIYER